MFYFNRTLKFVFDDNLINKCGKHEYTTHNLTQQEYTQLEACVQRHQKNQSLVWTPPVSAQICRAFFICLESKFKFSFILKDFRSHNPTTVLNLGTFFFFWIEFLGTRRSEGNRLHQDLPIWTVDLHCRWDDIYFNLFKFHKLWTVSSSQVRIFHLMLVGSYNQQG